MSQMIESVYIPYIECLSCITSEYYWMTNNWNTLSQWKAHFKKKKKKKKKLSENIVLTFGQLSSWYSSVWYIGKVADVCQ